MTRRAYTGGALPTTLSASVNTVATTVPVVALSGWPSGALPFFAVIERETANEEKVLCTAINGFNLTVLRGQDGTTAKDHAPGVKFEHCYTATDADEANAHINATGATHGLPVGSDFVGTSGAQTVGGKTFDFDPAQANPALKNTALNIPLAASPAIVADYTAQVQAEAATRAANDTALGNAIINGGNVSAPPGVIAMFGGAAAPSGWLLCDGSSQLRATYPALFAAIGTAYGSADGTHFNLPNLKGKFPVGLNSAETEFDVLGDTGGVKSVTLTTNTLPSHAHGATTSNVSAGDHTHNNTLTGVGDHQHTGYTALIKEGTSTALAFMRKIGDSFNDSGPGVQVAGAHSHTLTNGPMNGGSGSLNHQHAVAADGLGLPFTTLPPFLTVNFIIKATAATL